MALRLPAAGLIAALSAVTLTATACGPDPQAAGQRAFAWEPETPEERALRQKAEALQLTVGEGATAGYTIGALLGGLTGGMQGAFTGARLGRFIGAASGAYVRQLQAGFAEREAQLDQLAEDLEANNRDLESTIQSMRAVLAQQRARLASARATGNPEVIRRAQEIAAGNLAVMNRAVEAAESRKNVFGEARTLLAVSADTAPAAQPVNERYGALAARIASMRSIADTLVEEI